MYLSIASTGSSGGRPDETTALETIHTALDAGVTLIDTADVYCIDETDLGHNERLVAKALAGRSEKVVVATKGGLRRPRGAWTRDGRPDALRSACEASLRALCVSTTHLYRLHTPVTTVT